jgi:hypothetical protein
MAEKKSIYEEALLDVKKIQEALNANTKEILRSVAREEIDGLVKESLEEDDYEVEEAIDDEEGVTPEEGGEEEMAMDADSDLDAEEGDETEIEIDGDESDDTEMDAPEVGPEDQEIGTDADDASIGDEMNMIGASDDDVIAIYKKLSGDDEIEVVGDEIHISVTEPGEYIVKTGELGGSEEMGDEMEETDDFGEGMTYEIAMGDDDGSIEEDFEKVMEGEEDEEKVMKEEDEEDEEDEEKVMKEEDEEEGKKVEEKIGVGTGFSVGTHRNKTGPGSIGAPENPKSKNESVSSKAVISEAEIKYKKLLSESAQLKTENEEFRKALKKFRNMLVETVVFNSNLSYVTKLFMEHSTTKDEKKKIIQRFDEEVTNLKESKKLYRSIVNELSVRKPMTEAVENKIMKEVATGSSKQLNEATAYVDPSTQRIKDLIARVENKDKY